MGGKMVDQFAIQRAVEDVATKYWQAFYVNNKVIEAATLPKKEKDQLYELLENFLTALLSNGIQPVENWTNQDVKQAIITVSSQPPKADLLIESPMMVIKVCWVFLDWLAQEGSLSLSRIKVRELFHDVLSTDKVASQISPTSLANSVIPSAMQQWIQEFVNPGDMQFPPEISKEFLVTVLQEFLTQVYSNGQHRWTIPTIKRALESYLDAAFEFTAEGYLQLIAVIEAFLAFLKIQKILSAQLVDQLISEIDQMTPQLMRKAQDESQFSLIKRLDAGMIRNHFYGQVQTSISNGGGAFFGATKGKDELLKKWQKRHQKQTRKRKRKKK